MNKLFSVAVIAISMTAFGTAFAGGAGCDYGHSWRTTSVDEDKQAEAENKLVKLSVPAAEDTSVPAKATGNAELTKADDTPVSPQKSVQ